MRHRIVHILLTLTWLLPTVVSAEAWSFGAGAFQVEALPGYSYVRGVTPAYYSGPRGEMAIVSVHVQTASVSAERARSGAMRLVERTRSHFEGAEAKFGTPAWPIKETALSNGEIRLSSVVQITGKNGPEFLLQFAFISPNASAAILTIEGAGEAVSAWERFRAYAESARWQDVR